MADTGMPAGEYMGFLSARAAEILDKGRPSSYPESLAAVTQLAFDDLRDNDPAVAELIAICAFLAPEPVYPNWFTCAAPQLPGRWASMPPTRWHGVRSWLGPGRACWPASTKTGYRYTGSPRPSCAIVSRPNSLPFSGP